MQAVGAVLTGGASRRMGRTKALVDVDQIPMARRVAAALHCAGCVDVVLIGGDATELGALDLTVVTDLHPGDGPLGGVVTAMAWANSQYERLADGPTHVVIAACDLAFLDASTVSPLLDAAARDEADVVVAQTDRRQPSLGVWRLDAIGRVQAMFDGGTRSLNAALDGLACESYPVDAAAMANINRPEDLLVDPDAVD